MAPPFEIVGKYKNLPAEVIDTADDVNEAHYLRGEYALAYGSEWRVWSRPFRGTYEPPKKRTT